MREYDRVMEAQETAISVEERRATPLKLLQQNTADQYWQGILDSICDGFWVLDREWRCTYINSRQAQVVGMGKEDVLGKNVWELFPDLVSTEIYYQLHQAATNHTPVQFECFCPAWHGWFEIRVYPSIKGVSVLTTEITERKQVQEEARREREQHLKIALETAKLGFWEHDLVTDVLTCSEQCKANFGLPPDAEFSHETLFAALHPEDVSRIQAAIQRALEEHTEYEVEERCFWPDGSLHWLIARGRLVYDPEGTPVRMVGVTLDITERKQAEEALRQSERLYRAIREAIDYGIWVCAPDGRNIDASESFLRLVGLTQEQCSNFGWGEVSHPDDALSTLAAWKECVQSGNFWDVEHRFRGVDGQWHPILARGIPVRDENGEISGWAGINLDISRQKGVELQLRESEERFRALIEHAPDAIFIADTEGTYIDVNTSACRLLGYERDELIGKRIIDIIRPEDVPRLAEFKAPLLTGNTSVGEWVILRKDGTPVFVEVSSKTLPDGRCQAFIRDITERKRAEKEREQLLERERVAREQAEAANRIKDEFLAVLSHELRSPLNPILGWTRLLRTRKFDEQTMDKALAIIERNAKLQTQVIGDLLDVSGILQGKMALNVCPVNLVSIIEAAIETVRIAAQSKEIQIYTQFDSKLEPISGDPNRLQQIVWNLLSNAVKFTPSGGRVDVELKQFDAYTRIQVKDTGKGIVKEFLPHVFEYFRQEDSTTTRAFGGLGLGLAIVRHLVELHGGRVQVESLGEGQGATFTVLLPRIVSMSQPSFQNSPYNT